MADVSDTSDSEWDNISTPSSSPQVAAAKMPAAIATTADEEQTSSDYHPAESSELSTAQRSINRARTTADVRVPAAAIETPAMDLFVLRSCVGSSDLNRVDRIKALAAIDQIEDMVSQHGTFSTTTPSYGGEFKSIEVAELQRQFESLRFLVDIRANNLADLTQLQHIQIRRLGMDMHDLGGKLNHLLATSRNYSTDAADSQAAMDGRFRTLEVQAAEFKKLIATTQDQLY